MNRVLIFILFTSLAASAQLQRYDSFAATTTSASGIGNLTQVIPNATITVFNAPAAGVSCAGGGCVAATTYISKTGTVTCGAAVPLTRPTATTCIGTADAQGNFGFWAPTGAYQYCIAATNFTTQCYNTPLGTTNTSSLNNAVWIDGTTFPCTDAGVKAALASAITAGQDVWLNCSVSQTSTWTVGQNSPSHIPVTFHVLRGAVITCGVTGTVDCFQLASGSKFSCTGMLDGSYSQAQIVLASTAVVRDVFRAVSQDGSQESMGIEGCMVDGGAAGGAFLTSVYNYSEVFEGSFLQNSGATNYAASGGGACGIKIFTVAAASDGAAAIDFRHLWIIPSGNNKWVCIDGTANTGVFMNRLNFDQIQFRGNGTMTSSPFTITSGVNGQFKEFRFTHTAWAPATISALGCLLTVNGLYDSHFTESQVTFQSGTGTTIFCFNNNANQQNFGNCVDKISSGASTWTNVLVDSRAPSAGGSAQTIAWNGSGDMLAHYCQDSGNTTTSDWNQRGITIPANAPPGGIGVLNFAQTWTAVQTLNNPVLNSASIGAGNPTTAGVLGFDGNNVLKFGNGTISEVIPAVQCVTSQKTESAADANVLTCTPIAAAGTYRISFNISLSAANAATLGWTATWTDSNGTAQAPTNLPICISSAGTCAATTGALSTTVTASGSYDIDVNSAGTNIVIKLTFSGTSFTAKATATVERLI